MFAVVLIVHLLLFVILKLRYLFFVPSVPWLFYVLVLFLIAFPCLGFFLLETFTFFELFFFEFLFNLLFFGFGFFFLKFCVLFFFEFSFQLLLGFRESMRMAKVDGVAQKGYCIKFIRRC